MNNEVVMSLLEKTIYITSLGIRSPVGADALETALMTRIGISRLQLHPFMVDLAGEPIQVAKANYLSDELFGKARCFELAYPALCEVLAPLDREELKQPISLFLGLPTPQISLQKKEVEGLIFDLEKKGKESLPIGTIHPVFSGHAGGVIAMQQACRLIQSGDAAACLIGGIDSLIDPLTIDWLQSQEKLRNQKNPWGILPGEGAGFCLLSTSEFAQRHQLPLFLQVRGIGLAKEKKTQTTQEVCTGEGLTQAFLKALEGLPLTKPKVDNLICDLMGDRLQTDEYGFTLARLNSFFVDGTDYFTSVESWGDVGAATLPLHLCVAGIPPLRAEKSLGPLLFLFSGSPHEERGAVLLEKKHLTSKS